MGNVDARCNGQCCTGELSKSNELVEAQPFGSSLGPEIVDGSLFPGEEGCSVSPKPPERRSVTDPGTANVDNDPSCKAANCSAKTNDAGDAANQRSDKDGEANVVSLILKDGSTYTGQVVQKKRHGEGTWKSAGSEYEGNWKDDMQHGIGKMRWEDGRHYAGEFSRGKFHGVGRMEWTSPEGHMIYDGQYSCDMKHGSGRFQWADGRMYDGMWQHGKRSGNGTYINPKGEPKEGVWKDDKLECWVSSTPRMEESISLDLIPSPTKRSTTD